MQVTPLDTAHEKFGKVYNVIWVKIVTMILREPGQTKVLKSKPDLEEEIDKWVVVLTRSSQ